MWKIADKKKNKAGSDSEKNSHYLWDELVDMDGKKITIETIAKYFGRSPKLISNLRNKNKCYYDLASVICCMSSKGKNRDVFEELLKELFNNIKVEESLKNTLFVRANIIYGVVAKYYNSKTVNDNSKFGGCLPEIETLVCEINNALSENNMSDFCVINRYANGILFAGKKVTLLKKESSGKINSFGICFFKKLCGQSFIPYACYMIHIPIKLAIICVVFASIFLIVSYFRQDKQIIEKDKALLILAIVALVLFSIVSVWLNPIYILLSIMLAGMLFFVLRSRRSIIDINNKMALYLDSNSNSNRILLFLLTFEMFIIGIFIIAICVLWIIKVLY